MSSRPFNLHDWKTRWAVNHDALMSLDLAAVKAGEWRTSLHVRLALLTELADALASTPALEADYYCRPLLWACQDAARFTLEFAPQLPTTATCAPDRGSVSA